LLLAFVRLLATDSAPVGDLCQNGPPLTGLQPVKVRPPGNCWFLRVLGLLKGLVPTIGLPAMGDAHVMPWRGAQSRWSSLLSMFGFAAALVVVAAPLAGVLSPFRPPAAELR